MKGKTPHTISKYITAQIAEKVYGINAKTLLNRSGLPTSDVRYIPSINLKGGRRKYFERKLLDRLFTLTSNQENS